MRLTKYIALRFIGIAALIMLLSIPVFYVVIKKIMEKNVDESLRYQKEWIVNRLQNEKPENFSKFDHNIAVKEVEQILRNEDSYKTKNLYIENDDEFVNHRVLDFYREINGRKYHFKIRKSLLENEDILESIAVLQGMLFLILISALYFISKNVENKVWKPFYALLDELKKYRLDHHNFSVPAKSPVSEMNDLNVSLTDLTERNRQLYNAQKEFTENASHELQTPLAVMHNKLEMLLQTEPLNAQQAQYIQDIYQTNHRLSKMNKSLLLLARIENHQFESRNTISLKEICKKTAADFELLTEGRNIVFTENYETEKNIVANETLLQILVGNFISNTFKYTPENGEISIQLNEEYLMVKNTSANGSLDESRLFKRFQKQNLNSESNGLGLEICKKICELYGWDLLYFFSSGKHVFKIVF